MAKAGIKVLIVPDGGYGWVVCVAALFSNCIISGLALSAGVLLVEFIRQFDNQVSTISLILSLRTGLNLCVGPCVTLLLKRYSHRVIIMIGGLAGFLSYIGSAYSSQIEVLILTYGVVGGISLGICFFAVNVIVGQYFDKKRATAAGLAICGVGLGIFIFNNITEILLQNYGLSGTLLLSSGIVLNLVPLGAMVRPLRYRVIQDMGEVQMIACDGETKKTEKRLTSSDAEEPCLAETSAMNQEETQEVKFVEKPHLKSCLQKCVTVLNPRILRNLDMVLLCLIVLIWASQHTIIYYLPYYAIFLGMSRADGAIFVSLIGISWIIAKMMTGVYSDILHIRTDTILFVSLGAATISVISFPYCHSYWTIIGCTVCYSLSVGTVLPLRLTMITEIFTVEYITSGFSTILFFNGIGYTIFPPIFGKIYDVTESFPIVFRTNGAIYFVAVVFSLVILVRRIKRERMAKHDKHGNC